jgi:peptidoglycan biosynthesis protein MviN/MurJ (putative lipid II flippase)
MDMHYAILIAIVAVGSVVLLFRQLSRRFRHSSLWFRSAFLLASLFGITWSALGFLLLSHQKAGHTDLLWPRFWTLHCLFLIVGGVALGVLIALIISPEFWRRSGQTASSV